MIATIYTSDVFLTNLFNLSEFLLFFEIRKNPDVIKKNGTATRETIRVSMKSHVWLYDDNGDVWIAMIRNAAKNLK